MLEQLIIVQYNNPMLKIDQLVSSKDIKAEQIRLSIGVFCSVQFGYLVFVFIFIFPIEDVRYPLFYFILILLYILFLILLINEYPFTLTFRNSFLNIRYILKLLNRIAERLIVILASRSTEWQLGYLIISYARILFISYLYPNYRLPTL